MSVKYKLSVLLLFAAALIVSCARAQTKVQPDAARTQNDSPRAATEIKNVQSESETPQTDSAQVQTVFDLEETVKKEAKIPDAVIAVLKSDEIVDGCFREKGEGINEAELFSASEIDLNADKKPDLIIKPKDACLFGANQGPFWVFYKMRDGYQKILSASGLQLKVLPAKTNSFNKIEIGKVVGMKPASEIYSFRKGEYRAAK